MRSSSGSGGSRSRRNRKGGRTASWDSSDFDCTDFASNSSIANTNVDYGYDDHHLLTGTRLLTYDFVVRSLRRRLWKAFREDDVMTAMRAYQATLPDFIRWLEEEQQEKLNKERHDAAKKAGHVAHKRHSRSISPIRSFETTPSKSRRRSSWNQSCQKEMDELRHSRRGRRPGNRKGIAIEDEENFHIEKSNYRYELLKHQHQQRMETESMIGGPSIYILQSLMNPSDPFIADDFLCPHDESTFDHPPRKELPDPIQHAADKRAMEMEKKRRRKTRGPRMAFRRMITGKHKDRDFDLMDSMIVGATNNPNFSPTSENNGEEESPWMTTPLHEAARVGSGDLVRFMLASGGNPNFKNGQSQTAYHVCAGGYTAEEQKLVEAAAAVAAAEALIPTQSKHISTTPSTKKKFRRIKRNSKNKTEPTPPSSSSFDSTTEPLGGIPAVDIPQESLELIRVLDSHGLETSKEKKKSPSKKSKTKMKLFGKALSFRHKKGRHSDTTGDQLEGESHLETARKSMRFFDPNRQDELEAERMDAMVALLSFVHRESGEGPSINAVDHNGRTSLHYAAELGRSGVCTAMLAHFGIMLTIVDEMGTRTPCEIAADRSHEGLAALLEARALLYIDPYGLDDEMMDLIMAANEGGNGNRKNPNGCIVPPFRWFITLTKEDIARERNDLLDKARKELIEAFLETQSSRSAERDTNTLIDSNGMKANRDANLEPYITQRNNGAIDETIDDDRKLPAIENEEKSKRKKESPILMDTHLEQYMMHHKWDLESGLDAFRQNREEAFAAAGIKNIFIERKQEGGVEMISSNTFTCPICYDDEVEKEEWISLGLCGHGFCKDCVRDYLKEKSNNRTPAHLLTCPDHNCDAGLSKSDLHSLLENDDAKTLACIMDASSENFIMSHNNFKFCPHPGCSGIVHRFPQPKWASADYDENILNYTGAVCTAVTPSMETIGKECILTYEGVEDLDYTNCRSLQQPKRAHRFCFSCGEGVHWPLTCERLAEWKKRINDEIGKVDDTNGGSDFNELAQKVWLKANTRPCPKCDVPIEKAEGCNHMVCHNCHHEFCWICRQDWNMHSTNTGGFFRCNIWKEDDSDRILDKEEGDGDDDLDPYSRNNYFEAMMNDDGYGTSMHSARKAWKRKQEIRRFLDHYSHWEAHKDSNALEQKMADTVCTRLAPVVNAAIDFDGSPTFNFGGKGLSFIHNAFFELAECRSTLRHSYAFSFYRYPSKAFSKVSLSPPTSYLVNKRKEKFRFERLQAELETLTEQLSDIVARSHLRASQIQITYLTSGAAEKRLELNNFIFQIYREEKREALRQKKREEEARKHPPTASRFYAPTQNRTIPLSASEEMFNRLIQLREQRNGATPFLTVGELQSNGRDLSMQLMAQDERLHAIGERLRGMEGLLRSHNRRIYQNEDDDYDDDSDQYERSSIPASQMWACSRCTYMNAGGRFCDMCMSARYT